jgi:hypothetical protein
MNDSKANRDSQPVDEQKSPAAQAMSLSADRPTGDSPPDSVGQTIQAAGPASPVAFRADEVNFAAEWNVGDVILDLYEVKRIHEGGGMGLVYRVHHRGWDTELAVKSPRLQFFQTEAQKENFTREWLRPEGGRRQLEKMAAEWKGPPPMPWEKNA